MTYLHRLSYTLMLLIISTLAFSSESAVFHGWVHLELGAGNYGPDGHTKTSQVMPTLMKIEGVSNRENDVEDLKEMSQDDYISKEQYGILFWTLDELVKRYGGVGIFHVNDLYEEYALFAAKKLAEYAASKSYVSVVIEAVPGNYQLVDFQKALSQYGKVRYSTAHLKNPEVSLYHDQIDGDRFYASNISRNQTRSMLQNLANLSETGLYLFILYHEYFVPLEERTEFMEKDIFYHATNEWNSVPYIFPDGNIIDKEVGRVFHVKLP